MTQKSSLRIENCESDTKSRLQSNHFPVIADLKIKFKKPDPPKAPPIKYNKKSVWKDKVQLNQAIQEWIDVQT